ncbi:MAG: response regulator [Methanotrichaceae archaeon]
MVSGYTQEELQSLSCNDLIAIVHPDDQERIFRAIERQDYDLVLMDVKMPEMDGITATQVIRKLRPENAPKIIAITAFALKGDREKCLEAGMDDYISKPVKISDLADVLRKCQLSRVDS